MTQQVALLQRAEPCAHTASTQPIPQPLPEPMRMRPALAAVQAKEPSDVLAITTSVISGQPLVLIDTPNYVRTTHAPPTTTDLLKLDDTSHNFRENLEKALLLIKLDIKSEFAHILMLDATAAQAGIPEVRRETPRSTRVSITVAKQSAAALDWRIAHMENVPARNISINLPVTLTPERMRSRVNVLLEATRRAALPSLHRN